MLNKVLNFPKKPFIAIIGGAKVSDKILVIQNLLKKVDKILIGGGMAYTFLKAQGYQIGNSLVEEDYIEIAKKFLIKSKDKIILPIDHAISNKFFNNKRKITKGIDIPKGYMGLDLGKKTIDLYQKILQEVKTII
jgi:phosphoglycerate kinase